jgi:microsomal dipeptidase-like Zn-dependent dipeptidase
MKFRPCGKGLERLSWAYLPTDAILSTWLHPNDSQKGQILFPCTAGAVHTWHFFPSLDKYVDGLKEMAEIVGVDHVSIGTDQQVTPGSMQDYTQWVELVAAMLRGGFTPEDAGKIAGGNYMRIFRAAVG